jgi:two-component system chemotaxis response regulator CheB
MEDIKVLIVDDTVMYRKIVAHVVEQIEGAVVAGVSSNGELALSKMESANPDLVLLDVEMPVMDGLQTLKKIKEIKPDIGVIMVSGSSEHAAAHTIKALEYGAIDFVGKPEEKDPQSSIQALLKSLEPLIRIFIERRNKSNRRPAQRVQSVINTYSDVRKVAEVLTPKQEPPSKIDLVTIGISTGGPNALAQVIPALPGNLNVPIVCVQHMPPMFTASLAESLNKKADFTVKEGANGELIEPGVMYIAPGGHHMIVRKNKAGQISVGINDNPKENNCRPAVDVLLRSVAAHFDAKNVLSIIMTGMGEDGCKGVRALKRNGAYSITQTADSCVVYGMPRAVDEAQLTDESIPLGRIAQRISTLASQPLGV